jgi:antirestriction protein ArdC
VGIFGVLEGPSDLLEQRAALALLTQVDRDDARKLFHAAKGASVADDFLQTLLAMRGRWRAEGRRLGASPVTLSLVGNLATLVYAGSCAAHATESELGVELSAYDGNMQRAEEGLRVQIASGLRAFSMFDN